MRHVAEWHGVHTVLPGTHTFIHEWNEPSCMHFVSIHQMASPEQGGAHLDQLTNLLTPKGWKAESAWLAELSGWFTHISGHPSATGWPWDRESLLVKDRRSITVPCNQPTKWVWSMSCEHFKNFLAPSEWVKLKKMNASHICYQAFGLELIMVYRQSARRWL